YLQSRYYDANIGRFISPDTSSVITATPDALTDKNLYAYCDNNPVMRVDNGGEFWLELFAAVVVVVVVVAVVTTCANIGTCIASEIQVSNSDIAPMDDERYAEIVNAKDTTGLSRDEQPAYVRKVREESLKDKDASNDRLTANWTEAEMMREIVYHDRGYRLLKFFGLEDTKLGKK
ncbi:MAG: hypothetical protein J6V09_07600, partial [Clostridia bacterium]|nr:hypothetical protein [Clostridia bacterium]